jgi:hypothetical protein
VLAVLRECSRVDNIGVSLEWPYSNFSSLCIPDSDCLSSEPETMRLPSCENATELTPLVCPSSGPTTTSPSLHPRLGLSGPREPETMRLPSCENATELTQLWCVPLVALQQLLRSLNPRLGLCGPEPETMCLPSCENATEVTQWCVPLVVLQQLLQSLHPRLGLSGQTSQKQCACRPARMRQS